MSRLALAVPKTYKTMISPKETSSFGMISIGLMPLTIDFLQPRPGEQEVKDLAAKGESER